MIVTEKEARNKRCHRVFDNPAMFLQCPGSFCMAWRWTSLYERGQGRAIHLAADYAATIEPSRPVSVPADWEWCASEDGEPACWVEGVAAHQARRKGFCGLAGIPKEVK